jgi:hypothetical protein
VWFARRLGWPPDVVKRQTVRELEVIMDSYRFFDQ